jgi:hypothetical protein
MVAIVVEAVDQQLIDKVIAPIARRWKNIMVGVKSSWLTEVGRSPMCRNVSESVGTACAGSV